MFELRRMARRGRGFVLRSVYGFALLLAMYFSFEATVKRPALSAYQAYPDVSRFAGQFFEMFLLLQFVIVVLVTPAYVGGSIAEEKERRTLSLLLATPLTDGEIVLGKLAA